MAMAWVMSATTASHLAAKATQMTRPAPRGRPYFFVLLLSCLATPLQAATFEEFLVLGGDEFREVTGSNFLQGVSWETNPEQVYFECKDRLDRVSLKLWQKNGAWVSPRGAEPAPLRFGRHGSMRVFAMTDTTGEPAIAAYFMLESGDTHVFRIKRGSVVLSSIRWQCAPADWQPIPETGQQPG